MPRYEPRRIETRWQSYWEQNRTFETPNAPPAGSSGKLYVLDMFPYPSGSGLHVGHPEGYTATDIVCRYNRMKGKHVLHPMGWDAFGLPAEQHAIRTGTHPRTTTNQNIDTFRRQLKMLGFSYDWSRELSTTDEGYFRWTQWIFLELFDTWYDPTVCWTSGDGKARVGKGRPISELPIPAEVKAAGEEAVRRYQDKHRLAYISEAPVNWCPALGTVLANEEVIDGKSERGSHPVVRIPLRQWMLRITAYGDRLLSELEEVNWPESIKALQRNWIGRSTGAEVDFFVEGASRESRDESREHDSRTESLDSQLSSLDSAFADWKSARAKSGYPAEPEANVLRIYTTRPDTLFGATYMVVAPEHPMVERITTAEQREAVDAYRRQASFKSDLDRTDLAKEKTGVFTGAYAINPVNGERVPIWIADYVLISYGTGAIMAVPAHDERDFEFAVTMGLPVRTVVAPPDAWLKEKQVFSKYKDQKAAAADAIERATSPEHERPSAPLVRLAKIILDHDPSPEASLRELHRDFPHLFTEAFAGEGTAVNSGPYEGVATAEFKLRIAADLSKSGLGREAVNYRLRDWLFSRQHFWGEPFPIWHELDGAGNPTGLMRTDPVSELPVKLPDNFDFKPHGRPEPPLEEASDAWLYKTAPDGVRLKRETNSMPQWAGSCWYYLRFCDPKNGRQFIDPTVEKYWMPVDLYIGGAEHAVLHLLYARFWHKLLFDRGHVSTAEPFNRLVNQGMILGEAELTGYARKAESGKRKAEEEVDEAVVEFSAVPAEAWVSLREVAFDATSGEPVTKSGRQPLVAVRIPADQVGKQGNEWVLKERPEIAVESRAFKMSKSRGNVVNPDDVVAEYGADSLRMYEMFMGPLEQVKPWSMSGVEGVYRFLGRVWRLYADDRADDVKLNAAVQDVAPTDDQVRLLHKTIKAVADDIEKLSFNTAISRMMEFTNELTASEVRPRAVLEPFVLLLSPFAPHIAEELWSLLGHPQTLAYEAWPQYDAAKLVADEIELPVQISGKVRARIKVPAGADQQTIERLALADATVQAQLAGKSVAKIVVVPGRMVNIVTGK